MLPLLLMLVSDPWTPSAPVPSPNPEIRLRATNASSVPPCDGGGYQLIDQPSGPPELRPDLTYRPDGEVRRYLLLNRTVRGCPAPISYALPDNQGGVIRDLTPPSVRPPIRQPFGVQPPRSRE